MGDNYNFRSVFTAACLGMLLFGTAMTSLGAILPSSIDKFGLNTIQAGTLTSILPLGILIGSLLFGPIVDRYSYRSLLISCSLLITIGLEGMALSPNFTFLQVSFLLIGIGGGALNGGTNALVADISEARPDQRSANLSLLGIFFGIGALGVPALMALLSKLWSYEIILFYTGIATVLPLFYFLSITYPAPKRTQAVPLRASLAMIRDVQLVILGMFLFFESAVEGMINNWTTTFLQQEYQIESSTALLALSVYVLSLTVSRLLLSIILRKRSPFWVLKLSIFILLGGILLLLAGQGPVLFFAGIVLLGVGSAAGFPVILGYVGELYTELTGTAFSFVFVIALVGNILLNYIMGLVAEFYGIDKYPWVLLFCVLCLLSITLLWLPRILKSNLSNQ